MRAEVLAEEVLFTDEEDTDIEVPRCLERSLDFGERGFVGAHGINCDSDRHC